MQQRRACAHSSAPDAVCGRRQRITTSRSPSTHSCSTSLAERRLPWRQTWRNLLQPWPRWRVARSDVVHAVMPSTAPQLHHPSLPAACTLNVAGMPITSKCMIHAPGVRSSSSESPAPSLHDLLLACNVQIRGPYRSCSSSASCSSLRRLSEQLRSRCSFPRPPAPNYASLAAAPRKCCRSGAASALHAYARATACLWLMRRTRVSMPMLLNHTRTHVPGYQLCLLEDDRACSRCWLSGMELSMLAYMAGCGPTMVVCRTTGAALRTADCRTSPDVMRMGPSSVFHLNSAAAGTCFAAPAAVHGMGLSICERVKVNAGCPPSACRCLQFANKGGNFSSPRAG